MSPFVNHLLNQRKRAIQNGNTEANTRLQEKINKLIRENQLSAVKQEFGNQKTGSESWWSNVNSITSRKKKRDVSVSASLNPREINKYFQSVNTDPNYIPSLFKSPKEQESLRCQFMKFNIFY